MCRPCPISHLHGGSSTPSREASERSKRASAGFPKSDRQFVFWTRARPLEPSLVNCTVFLLERQSNNSVTISYSAYCDESSHCRWYRRRHRIMTEHLILAHFLRHVVRSPELSGTERPLFEFCHIYIYISIDLRRARTVVSILLSCPMMRRCDAALGSVCFPIFRDLIELDRGHLLTLEMYMANTTIHGLIWLTGGLFNLLGISFSNGSISDFRCGMHVDMLIFKTCQVTERFRRS